MDNSLVKRVELHCHTKMSDMDGVSDVADIIKRAKKWGMPALAVTDHGCVQAFTGGQPQPWTRTIRLRCIYGVEGYLVDDTKQLVENPEGIRALTDPYVVFDIETTGFSPDTEQDHRDRRGKGGKRNDHGQVQHLCKPGCADSVSRSSS